MDIAALMELLLHCNHVRIVVTVMATIRLKCDTMSQQSGTIYASIRISLPQEQHQLPFVAGMKCSCVKNYDKGR